MFTGVFIDCLPCLLKKIIKKHVVYNCSSVNDLMAFLIFFVNHVNVLNYRVLIVQEENDIVL